MIEVRDLCKTFKVARREAGFGQAVKALFHREYEYIHALDGVSFSIGDGEMVGFWPQWRGQEQHYQDPQRHPHPRRRRM